MKFKYKISIALCCVMLAASFGISAIWYDYSKEMIVDNAYETTELLLKERDKKLVDTITTINNQMRMLAYNNSMADRYLNNTWKNEYLDNQAVERMESFVTDIYISNPEINSVEIGNYEGKSFYRGQKIDEEFWQEDRAKDLYETTGEYVVLGMGENIYHPEKVLIFNNILYYGKVIGYCAVTLDERLIAEIFDDTFQEEAVISVRTRGGEILYTSEGYESYLENEKLLSELGEHENALIRDGFGDEWLLVGSEKSSPFVIGAAVPVRVLLGNMSGRFVNILMITGIMLCLLLAVIYVLTKWIGCNVDNLTAAIQTFSKGRMDAKVKLDGKDEFGKVSEAFNIMTQDIKKLMEDIKEKEKEKMTLEIRSLQGQINLHFLFNTLNTIKNLCHIQRVTNVEHLVDAFMQLLHISMGQETEFIDLKTELEYTKCYIEIYKYKSIYPIQYYIEIEPEIEHAKVLKFMIQPIVENAIVHGLEACEEEREGLIFVKAVKEDDNIVITVLDNGKGFDTSKMSLFNGIGLSNTEKRIHIHYGSEFGITAESVEGVSTSITVKIPFREA